ncbi:LamG-like jellyroll fold domain-containing protein [Streptomyces sp. NPDC001537]
MTTDNADGASFPAAIGSTRDSNGTEQPPATNTWVLLTGVYDSATDVQTLYVNGVATGTAAQNTTPVYVPTGHLNIGANSTATGTSPYNQWPGSVADVRTYQAALTADQVHQLYTSS